MFNKRLSTAALTASLFAGAIAVYIFTDRSDVDDGISVIDMSKLPPTAAGGPPTLYPYLDDVYSRVDAPDSPGPFPKVMLTETQSLKGTAEQFSKYDVIGTKAGMMAKVAAVQRINPNVRFHYSFSPRAYQGESLKQPCNLSMGLPFAKTGPATTDCAVYAGHWLYYAGTKLARPISASDTTVYVDDASKLAAGEWVVIYNPPAGSFNNAEHAKVVSVNKSTHPHQVKLASRGFKSVARSHGQGAIVARHVTGRGGSTQNWAYNVSLDSPRDAKGNTMAEALAEWLAENYTKEGDGKTSKAIVDGVYFDADRYFINTKNYDINNDLIVDGALSSDGINLWGEGLNDFYALVRQKLPDLFVVGGERLARGFGSLNGTQMESWPSVGGTDHVAADYGHTKGNDGFDSMFQRYKVYLQFHETNEGYVENLSKSTSKLYYFGKKAAPDNSSFRFGLGSTLLGDGYFGQQNSAADPDPWYDEYAVDVVPNSPTYGHAIKSNPNDESVIRDHKGWLGSPLDAYYRLYDEAQFAPKRSLLINGGFENGTTGWTFNNVVASAATSDSLEGSKALRIARHSNFAPAFSGASIKGDKVQLKKGKEYTLAFAAKSSSMREISVRVQGSKSTFLIPKEWVRVVHTFKVESDGYYRPQFNVGQEDTTLWLDAIYLFEGNANVFAREFDNGLVVVNATPSARTISLPEPYLRIKGTGQDPINNGAEVESVRVAAYDAAILVRREFSEPPVVDEPVTPPVTPPVAPPAAPPASDDSGDSTAGTPQDTGSDSDGGTANDVTCGEPDIRKSDAVTVYVWEDTCTAGKWHLRTRSNSGWKAVEGKLSASKAFVSVTGVRVESHDTIDTAQPGEVNYRLKVGNDAVDGIDFEPADGAKVCIEVAATNGAKLRLGSDGKVASGNVDIATGAACGLRASLGKPQYDGIAGNATFLWEDDGGTWHVVVKGDGKNGKKAFKGRVTGSQVTSLTRWNFEPADSASKTADGLRYEMVLWRSGKDGVNFKLASGTTPCFNMTSPPGNKVYLGKDRKPVSLPLNLATLKGCTP